MYFFLLTHTLNYLMLDFKNSYKYLELFKEIELLPIIFLSTLRFNYRFSVCLHILNLYCTISLKDIIHDKLSSCLIPFDLS